MAQFKYRFDEIVLSEEVPHADQITAWLNETGRGGWRVAGIYLAEGPSWATRKAPVLLESALGQFEYRYEQIALSEESSHADQLEARLNQLGGDGWQVAGIFLAEQPSWSTRFVPVLLERALGE
jgi:hypothetical protein